MFSNHKILSLLAALAVLFFAGGVTADVKLESEMTQQKQATPGERYRGSIVLRNPGEEPAEAKLYQTDYSFDADGQNQFGPPGQQQRSNATWIGLSREIVTVPANGTERVDYEVVVPTGNDASLSGTYWSMIMVEPIAAGSAEAANALPERTTRVTQVMRYGVQVVTHIGESGESALVFDNPHLIEEEGARLFAIDVENTGQRWLIPNLWLELYEKNGTSLGKFEANGATRLYPGTSARFRIDLGGTPKGTYLGLVAADGDGDNLFGANVELTID